MTEKIKISCSEIVYNRNLTSYMNNTKWREFQNAMNNEMPFPPAYNMKTLFEDDRHVKEFKSREYIWYFGDYSDETFGTDNYQGIEYVVVKPYYYEKQGGVLVCKNILHSAKEEFTDILKKYNIPYETENDYFIIYGYK